MRTSAAGKPAIWKITLPINSRCGYLLFMFRAVTFFHE